VSPQKTFNDVLIDQVAIIVDYVSGWSLKLWAGPKDCDSLPTNYHFTLCGCSIQI